MPHIDHVLVADPGKPIRLKDIDPGATSGLNKARARKRSAKRAEEIGDLAYRLYAEHRRSILLVLQGMDTSGKDGAIRHFAGMLNPQCTPVYSFKQPSSEELSHDFLWRCHQRCPEHGQIGVFNRSHYEDVLVVRVHNMVPPQVWSRRYDQINKFENILAENGTTIIKFFLHISRQEQGKRLKERKSDPTRSWKYNPDDEKERLLWDDYQKAYEDALNHCGTGHAPWCIVPADHKWHRDYVITEVLARTLRMMRPEFPKK